MRTWSVTAALLAMWVLSACSGGGEGGGGGTDTAAPGDVDAGGADGAPRPDAGEDATAPEDGMPPDTAEPARCLGELAAGQTVPFDGLDGPVEIVVDAWGVPHVYASTEADLFRAEGFIVAKNRIVSMHAMRRIASGAWAASPAAGPGDLANDVYMRILGLRRTAEEIWALTQAEDPEVAAMLTAFSEGVNRYIDAANAGTLQPPLEWFVIGAVEPWTPVDSLAIGRLQSWDLSFEGQDDKIAIMARYLELTEKTAGTPLAGLFLDLHPLAPATNALSMPASQRKPGGAGDALAAARLLDHPAYRKLPAGWFRRVGGVLRQVPLVDAALQPRDQGSNNWTVAGALTASGGALVANDTHLSLRNPAVFMEVHLNTARAGGDLDAAGVCFPGIPGIILGRNAHAAWGATVYYADVTDVYMESYTAGDPATVAFDGGQVEVEIRPEVFEYGIPEEGCEAWINDFIAGTTHAVEEVEGRCRLTVDVEVVPHHGPVIPGSRTPDGDGGEMALSWRWTGMEPSRDIKAVYGLLRVQSPEEFLASLEDFGVGSQNWVYGDVDGHIAYTTFSRVPVRGHLATLPVEHPTFLPMPGEGCCEWTGDVPLDQMPHALDPEEGYILTANGDALGYTLDGDPYNDPSFQGFLFDAGFRAARLHGLMDDLVAAGEPLDVPAMQALQADHRSPLGERLTPHILQAVAAAEAGDETLSLLLDDALLEARDRLAAWSFLAAHGLGDDATAAEQDDAVATSIFNAWLVHLMGRVVGSRMETPYNDQFGGRFLVRLFEHPEQLMTWDGSIQDSLLWDDPATPQVLEWRNLTILLALKDALAFLSDPADADVLAGGGFGTGDQDQWRWGRLHAITLKSALGGEANIPPASQWPEGYPRHGDNFCVDAAHPGMNGTDFHFSSGAAIRNVYDMDPAGVQVHAVIPGGEDAAAFAPHYADLFSLWAENQTAPIHADPETLLEVAESCVFLAP